MVKGTPSFGKHHKKTHIRCRRCGRHSFHARHKCCAACGFGRSKRTVNHSWQNKKINGTRLI